MDPMMLMLGVALIALIGLQFWSKRSNQKRVDERDQMLKEQLVPGAWVHTSIGFYGRFVDLDGDVLILETPSGEETYWNKAVIRSIGDIPFQDETDTDDEVLIESDDEYQADNSEVIEVEATDFDASSSDDAESDSQKK